MSVCKAVNRFAQPGQRHRWSAVKAVTVNGRPIELYRHCLNFCGAEQTGTEIPASVRRQYQLVESVAAGRK